MHYLAWRDARLVTIAALILLFLGFDAVVLTTIAESRGEFVIVLVYGICVGQLSLVAIWAALGPGPVVVRLPWSFLLSVLMWCTIILGGVNTRGLQRSDVSVEVGIFLLAGMFLIQLPLWTAAKLFGWRLRVPSTAAGVDEQRKSQYRVKDLMLGMFFCAAALALGRIALVKADVRLPPQEWRIIAVAVPVYALSSLLITLPALWAGFVPRNLLVISVGPWLLYCVVTSGIEMTVLTVIFGPPPNSMFVAILIINLSQCVTVVGVLLMLRAVGVRLQRRVVRATEPVEDPVVGSPFPEKP